MTLAKNSPILWIAAAMFGFCFFFQCSISRAADPTARQISRKEAIQMCKDGVVRVERMHVGDAEARSFGTAFFVSDTLLVTNHHVVGELIEGADEFRRVYSEDDVAKSIFWITFREKKYRAYFVGRDPTVDLAHLRIEERIPGTRPLPLANSAYVEVGESVIACGNPHGKENTISFGSVTGQNRVLGLVAYEDYIQTDAAVNPGNSGGPLISLADGGVIGIVNSRIPGANNMGFVIPVNIYHAISSQLSGTKRRSWLGIKIPDEDWKDREGLEGVIALKRMIDRPEKPLQQIRAELSSSDRGVLVVDVMRVLEEPYFDATNPDARDLSVVRFSDLVPPAHRAGLKPGDIIRELNDATIQTSRDFIAALLLKSKPYMPIRIRVIRFSDDGARHEVELTLAPIVQIPESVRAGFY